MTTPTNPHAEGDQDLRARWDEGYADGLADNDETFGEDWPVEQRTAYENGHKEGGYTPAPFNPALPWADVDTEGVTPHYLDIIVTWVDIYENEEGRKRARLIWDVQRWRAFTKDDVEVIPVWTHNRPEDRSVPMEWHVASNMVMRGLGTELIQPASVDLPCPPYNYEYSGGGMEISSGKFKKFGSKGDWEDVLAEMQEKVENMPAGINIADGHVELNVTVTNTVTTTVMVPLTQLVEHDDEYVYTGDADELESDVDNALNNGMGDYEVSELIDWDYGVDWSYGEPEVSEWSCDDSGYDIRNSTTEV